MRYISEQMKAEKAAYVWDEQYGISQNTRSFYLSKQIEISEKLHKMDPPTPDKVDEIIGNGSWTRCDCHECQRSVDAIVEIGDHNHEYERLATRLCRECLEKALKLFDDDTPTK